jgi:hypothetical protein
MNANHAVLTAEEHRELRVRIDRGVELGDGVMASLAMPREFRDVQRHYPILFRMNSERDGFTALAMFGFEAGENLFLKGDQWEADYLPLAIDIQPFLIGRADVAGERQVHVDLASPRIASGEGVRVFEPEGMPTPYLETVAEKLGALDAGYRESVDFFQALQRHRLLEPMTLEITLEDGSTNRLVGYHGIDEERLRELSGSELGELHEAGHLMPIFMAVASLGNIRSLVERKNGVAGHG